MITAYLIAINVITLLLFGSDKISSQSGAWRVSERTLFILALLGGSPAVLLGMKLFRHKTRKASFQLIFAVIILVQIVIGIGISSRVSLPNQGRGEGWGFFLP